MASMTAAVSRSRLAPAVLLALALGVLLASPAAARSTDVVSVSVVRDSAGKVRMEPTTATAADGDTIKICNKSDVIPLLFSYSPHNVFSKKPGTGVKVVSGACHSVVVHNPTEKNIPVLILSEIQDSVRLRVTVSPACKRATQSAGAKCKPAAAAAGTYTLVSSKLVENPYGTEVTVNPTPSGSSTWKHCCDGGKWETQYSWKFPSMLIPGKAFSISMSIKTVLVEPRQPFNDQMTALAPGFRQDLPTQYPGQPSASKTYSVPFSESYRTDPNQKELKLYVGAAHATVVFTYRRN
jgi:hypothetical protein